MPIFKKRSQATPKPSEIKLLRQIRPKNSLTIMVVASLLAWLNFDLLWQPAFFQAEGQLSRVTPIVALTLLSLSVIAFLPLLARGLGVELRNSATQFPANMTPDVPEDRFRQIFNSTYQFIGLLSPDGTLLEANQTALEFGGLKPQDVLGKPFWECYWWTDESLGLTCKQQHLRQAVNRAAQGELVRYEVQVRGKNDTNATIDFSLKPILDEQGKVIYIVPEGRDITHFKTVVNERDTFFNNSIELMCVADTDGYLQVTNPAFEQVLGFSAEEMQGKRIDQMTHPDDLDKIRAGFKQLAQGQPLTNFEHRHRCQDGSYRWLAWNVFPVLEKGKLYCFAQDIEAQKQAQNQQVATNYLLQGILDSTNDLTAALDAEYRYTAFTQAYQQEFKKVFGVELAVGMKLPEVLADLPTERENAVAVWQRALAGEEYTIKAQFGDPGRERNYYELNYKAIRNAQGKITGAVQIGRNITQRQTALNRLEDHKQEFALAENSPDVIARYDRDYRTLYINPAVEVENGIPQETFLGKTLEEVGYPEDFTQMWESWLAQAFAGEKIVRELSKETPQGTKSYQTQIVPEFDVTGEVQTVLAITRNITNLKTAERQLRKSEILLSEAQSLTHLGSWELDPETEELVWSKEMYQIFGLDPHRPPPTWVEQVHLFHPDDWETVVQTAQRLQKTGLPQKFEYRIIRPNGEIRYLEGRGKVLRNWEGKIIKIIGTALDFTERKVAEIELQQLTAELEDRVNQRTVELRVSETRFRSAIENAPFPIAIHAEDGEMVQINRRWTELTGYTLEDIPTVADWTEKAYGERQESVREIIDQLYALNERVAEGEFTIRTKTGKERIWDFSSAPLGILDGKNRFVISMAKDITQQKQAQSELQATQELFEKFMYYSPVASYIKDTQGRYRFVNRFMEKMWQRPLAEWIGKTDADFFSPEVTQAIRESEQQVLATQKAIQTEEIRENGDGIHHWLSLKFPIESSTGETLIAGKGLDITDRVRAESVLRERESRIRCLINANIIGVFFTDFSGHIDEANQAFLDMVGYTPEDLANGRLNWEAMTPPEYRELDRALIETLQRERVTPTVEKEYIRKDGTRVPVLVGVALLADEPREDYCVCYAIDISDRKEAQVEIERKAQQQTAIAQIGQQALADRELSALFQQTTELVATVLEVEYCKVLRLLDNGEEVFLEAGVGWQPGLVGNATVGTDLDSQAGYTLLCDQPVVVEDLRTETRFSGPPLLREHNVVSGMSVVIRDKDGIFGVFGAHTTQKRDFSEDEVNFLQTVANILSIAIARHQTEKEVHKLNQTLETKVKERTRQLEDINEELKSFTYSVSHDLRAPLRAIQGFASALEEDYGDDLDDLGKDYTQRLTTAAQRLDTLIQDLLAYSRLSRTDLRLKPIDLAEVVQEAQKTLAEEIRQKQAQISVSESLGKIKGNRSVLTQIVTNLLHNALKFTEESVQPQIRIWSETNPDTVRLYVQDNGIGISPEHQERIFNVFERLHGIDTYSGTGIGLAIVRKGMERLGGDAGVDSTLGQGSQFWIEGQQPTSKTKKHD